MVGAPDRIPPTVRAILGAPTSHVALSPVSIWEIAIKRSAGRLRFPLEWIDEIIATLDLALLPILPARAIRAAELPRHHGDPFDRMLIAQATVEGLTLVTRDDAIARCDVPILQGLAGA